MSFSLCPTKLYGFILFNADNFLVGIMIEILQY